MQIAINKLFAQLLFWLLDLLDSLMGIFKILCGIPYEVNGEQMSLIDVFLQADAVQQAFLGLFIISIFVMAVAVIVAVVKNIIRGTGPNGERKSHGKTVMQGVGSIITSLVMALVMITGISVANGVLVLVDNQTQADSDLTLSKQIFVMCIDKEYLYTDEDQYAYRYDEYGARIQMYDENGDKLYCAYDDDGLPLRNADGSVDSYTSLNNVPTENKGEQYETEVVGKKVLYVDGEPQYADHGWYNFSPSENEPMPTAFVNLDFGSSGAVNKMFGVHRKSWFVEDADKGYRTQPIVQLSNFNMFMCYLAVVMILIALVWSMLSLVKRLFDLVFLFLILPLISATIPLDDGARFKSWRETVVSKVVLAYGAILSVNVYILILPQIMALSVGQGAIMDGIFRIFLLIGGALAVNGGQLLLSRLMGTSAEEGREMASSARALMGGAATAIGGLGMLKRAAVGGTNRYGRQTKGVLGGAAKVGGIGIKGLNAIGNALSGDAYRRGAATVANAVSGAKAKAGNKLGNAFRIGNAPATNASAQGGSDAATDNKLVARETGRDGALGLIANRLKGISSKPQPLWKHGNTPFRRK